METDDILKTLEDRVQAAIKLAAQYGEIVGYVSRTSPSMINEEGGYVVFDVDPTTYFSNFQVLAQAGSHLGVVDIKTLNLISLRITSVERRDVLAELDLPDMYFSLPHTEVSGLLTKTRIKAKPLLAFNPETGEVVASNFVIEPQSPVVLLKDPGAVQAVLGLPTEGVFVGYVTIGDTPVLKGGAPLFIPLKAFYQHVLIVGTTGSGKTTLLKNIIASIKSGYRLPDSKISVVIIDPNKDYVTLPLKPPWKFESSARSEEIEIADKTLTNLIGLSGVVIILPVTRSAVEQFIEKAETWARVLKLLAENYIESVLAPIARRFGWRFKIVELEVYEEPTKRGVIRLVKAVIEIDYREFKDTVHYYIIPYALRFTDFKPKEFIALNPYFTRQAKDGLLRLLHALSQKNAHIETVYDLYEALKEARSRIDEKQSRPRGPVLDPNKEYVVELIKDLAIHKSTLENMIRQVASLTDTGIFDVYVKGQGDRYLREPPLEEVLERHFELFQGLPIVVDLEFLQLHSQADPEKTISIVAFRVLNKVFEWKLVESRVKFETQPVLIFIDEAHRFFPSRGGVEEYIEHVSSMIDRIARLGRARRLGLVFSTHSPKDVHDIILQLTNTKIVLRTDKTHLQSLDLPEEYRDFITRASDRVGVIKSHVLRLGYATFKTPLPLAGHYDLSAIP